MARLLCPRWCPKRNAERLPAGPDYPDLRSCALFDTPFAQPESYAHDSSSDDFIDCVDPRANRHELVTGPSVDFRSSSHRPKRPDQPEVRRAEGSEPQRRGSRTGES